MLPTAVVAFFISFAIPVFAIDLADLDVNSLGLATGDDLVSLMARDSEPLPGPLSFGHKFMTGGAGEGEQRLTEDEEYKQRQQVKSDAVLPAYCEPPNPCPVGFSASNGCLEEFDNSADFSREYQAQQQCICDHEHMFNCAEKSAGDAGESLQQMLDDNGLHQNMIAKKFHEKRSGDTYVPRKKRSVAAPAHPKSPNPYLGGERLIRIQKKDGKHLWE